MDMMQAIKPKSDQLNADDLIAGSMHIFIRDVKIKSEGQDQPVSVYFDGDNGKPYKPCKSMARAMVALWGAESKNYVGKCLKLFRDNNVSWGGVKVGGIRISHASHIDQPIIFPLSESKNKRVLYKILPIEFDMAIKLKGDDSAAQGIKQYTNFLATLTPEQKASIREFHTEWSRIAKSVIVKDSE